MAMVLLPITGAPEPVVTMAAEQGVKYRMQDAAGAKLHTVLRTDFSELQD